MRRAVLAVILIALGAGIAFAVYAAYNYSEEVLEFDEISKKQLTIDSDGNFVAEFSCEKEGRRICGYEYELEGGNLYITLLATPGEKEAFEVDAEGYVKIIIECPTGVEKFYYRAGDKDSPLNVDY